MFLSRKIKYFLAAAEHLHFSAASAELCISQPALSRSMRQLEELIGVKLFKRTAKGVVLTGYGEILLRRARLVELESKYTLDEIRAIKLGSGGTLKIGAGPVWLRGFLPSAIVKLQAQHLNLQIDLRTGVLETHLAALLAGKIDLLCGDLDFPEHPELAVLRLIEVEFIVIAGEQHPLANQDDVAVKDLLNYRWISLRGDFLGKNRLGSFFAAQNLPSPESGILVSPDVPASGILREGNYLAYVPRQTLEVVGVYGCVKINLAGPLWVARHGLVYRKRNITEPAVSSFVSIMKDQFGISQD